jgi:hypothetical protein
MTDETSIFDVVSSHIEIYGLVCADAALKSALNSTDIALAILGVAAGIIINRIEPERRAEVMLNYLSNFEESSNNER